MCSMLCLLFHASTCRMHCSVISSSMTYRRVYDWSNTTGATSGAGTAYPSWTPGFIPSFRGIRVTRSLVLCVMFYRSLFVHLPFLFWPLYCLSLDLRILITPLVSSTFLPSSIIQLLSTSAWKGVFRLGH